MPLIICWPSVGETGPRSPEKILDTVSGLPHPRPLVGLETNPSWRPPPGSPPTRYAWPRPWWARACWYLSPVCVARPSAASYWARAWVGLAGGEQHLAEAVQRVGFAGPAADSPVRSPPVASPEREASVGSGPCGHCAVRATAAVEALFICTVHARLYRRRFVHLMTVFSLVSVSPGMRLDLSPIVIRPEAWMSCAANRVLFRVSLRWPPAVRSRVRPVRTRRCLPVALASR